MPVLPIPMILALVLLAFLAHRMATRETHATLLALIASCALQGVVVSLVQYYGVTALRPLQPLLASVIPAVAWLAFRQAAGGAAGQRDIIIHSAGFVLALLCLLLQPLLLDILIPALFAGYGVAMLLRLGRGEDSLPHSRLESGAVSVLAWRIIAVSLIVSALADVVIAYYLAIGERGALLWVPSVVSSLTLLCLGAVSLSQAVEGEDGPPEDEPALSPEDSERHQSIVARLDDYVETQKPFLDPDLTLARLSRKLTIPAKQLSRHQPGERRECLALHQPAPHRTCLPIDRPGQVRHRSHARQRLQHQIQFQPRIPQGEGRKPQQMAGNPFLTGSPADDCGSSVPALSIVRHYLTRVFICLTGDA